MLYLLTIGFYTQKSQDQAKVKVEIGRQSLVGLKTQCNQHIRLLRSLALSRLICSEVFRLRSLTVTKRKSWAVSKLRNLAVSKVRSWTVSRVRS